MTTKTPNHDELPPAAGHAEEWLAVVLEKVSRLRFGSVQIVVHDGRVTQVESLERTRFAANDGQRR